MNEREAFEAAMQARHRPISRTTGGQYTSLPVEIAWAAWQDRAALASAPAATQAEPVAYLVDWDDIGEGPAKSLFYDENAKEHMETAVRFGRTSRNRSAKVTPLYAAPTPQATAPAGVGAALQFVCQNGCGQCGVKLVDFVTHATQAQEGDPWVTVASEPQIVSTCCGSPVEVWDERKQEVVGTVDATPPSQAPAEVEARVYPLPDDLYPGSKDWMAADYAGRVEWLHTMYEAKKRESEGPLAGVEAAQQGQFDPAVPTNDRLRAIARQARDRNGPSDTTNPAEYVLEGWREAEKYHGVHPWTMQESHPQEGRMP